MLHPYRLSALRDIAGTDEAGRGPLAGPVFAGCVLLGERHGIVGLKDSKRLSVSRREEFFAQITARATAWGIASASVAEIDVLNILRASLLAMSRAIAEMQFMAAARGKRAQGVIADGLHAPAATLPVNTLVRGDALLPQISAASILAKVARDRYLCALHEREPQYGFDQHKGYPTRAHIAALQRFGPGCEHRRSFAPVAAALRERALSNAPLRD